MTDLTDKATGFTVHPIEDLDIDTSRVGQGGPAPVAADESAGIPEHTYTEDDIDWDRLGRKKQEAPAEKGSWQDWFNRTYPELRTGEEAKARAGSPMGRIGGYIQRTLEGAGEAAQKGLTDLPIAAAENIPNLVTPYTPSNPQALQRLASDVGSVANVPFSLLSMPYQLAAHGIAYPAEKGLQHGLQTLARLHPGGTTSKAEQTLESLAEQTLENDLMQMMGMGEITGSKRALSKEKPAKEGPGPSKAAANAHIENMKQSKSIDDDLHQDLDVIKDALNRDKVTPERAIRMANQSAADYGERQRLPPKQSIEARLNDLSNQGGAGANQAYALRQARQAGLSPEKIEAKLDELERQYPAKNQTARQRAEDFVQTNPQTRDVVNQIMNMPGKDEAWKHEQLDALAASHKETDDYGRNAHEWLSAPATEDRFKKLGFDVREARRVAIAYKDKRIDKPTFQKYIDDLVSWADNQETLKDSRKGVGPPDAPQIRQAGYENPSNEWHRRFNSLDKYVPEEGADRRNLDNIRKFVDENKDVTPQQALELTRELAAKYTPSFNIEMLRKRYKAYVPATHPDRRLGNNLWALNEKGGIPSKKFFKLINDMIAKHLEEAGKPPPGGSTERAMPGPQEGGDHELYRLIKEAKANGLDTSEIHPDWNNAQDTTELKRWLDKWIDWKQADEARNTAMVERDALWERYRAGDISDHPGLRAASRAKIPSTVDRETFFDWLDKWTDRREGEPERDLAGRYIPREGHGSPGGGRDVAKKQVHTYGENEGFEWRRRKPGAPEGFQPEPGAKPSEPPPEQKPAPPANETPFQRMLREAQETAGKPRKPDTGKIIEDPAAHAAAVKERSAAIEKHKTEFATATGIPRGSMEAHSYADFVRDGDEAVGKEAKAAGIPKEPKAFHEWYAKREAAETERQNVERKKDLEAQLAEMTPEEREAALKRSKVMGSIQEGEDFDALADRLWAKYKEGKFDESEPSLMDAMNSEIQSKDKRGFVKFLDDWITRKEKELTQRPVRTYDVTKGFEWRERKPRGKPMTELPKPGEPVGPDGATPEETAQWKPELQRNLAEIRQGMAEAGARVEKQIAELQKKPKGSWFMKLLSLPEKGLDLLFGQNRFGVSLADVKDIEERVAKDLAKLKLAGEAKELEGLARTAKHLMDKGVPLEPLLVLSDMHRNGEITATEARLLMHRLQLSSFAKPGDIAPKPGLPAPKDVNVQARSRDAIRVLHDAIEGELFKQTDKIAAGGLTLPVKPWLERQYDSAWKVIGDAIGEVGTETSTHKLLDALIKHPSKDMPYVKALARILRKYVQDMPVYSVDVISSAGRKHVDWKAAFNYGAYSRADVDLTGKELPYAHIQIVNRSVSAGNAVNDVILNPAKAILHEIVHAATTRFMKMNPNHPLTLRLQSIAMDLQLEMRRKAKSTPTGMDDFSKSLTMMEHERELLSYGFTEPGFADLIFRHPPDWNWVHSPKKVFNSISSVLRKMFRAEGKEGDLLDDILHTGRQIMKAEQEQRKLYPQSYNVGPDRKFPPNFGGSDPIQVPRVVEKTVAEAVNSRQGQEMTGIWDELLRKTAPESRSADAKTGGAMIARSIGELVQKTTAWRKGSAAREKYWQFNRDLADGFYSLMERGQKPLMPKGKGWFGKTDWAVHDDPVIRDMAQGYRNWLDAIEERDHKRGLPYEPWEHYIPHMFEKAGQVTDWMYNLFTPKQWRTPAFMQTRMFDTIQQAKRAGFKLKYDNPEQLMLARQAASDKAHMQLDLLDRLVDAKLAMPKHKLRADGIKKDIVTKPEGWSERRAPNGKFYYVHNDVMAILHNAFDQPGLWGGKEIQDVAYRRYMGLKNHVVPVKLAINLFHPLHVAGIDQAQYLAQMGREFAGGKLTGNQAISYLVKAGTGTVMNSMRGWHMMKLWEMQRDAQGRLPTANPTEALALQYMQEGGFIPVLSDIHKLGMAEQSMKALRQRQYYKLWQAPWAIWDGIQKQAFEKWIPSLKTAAYLSEAEQAIRVRPELLDNHLERGRVFRDIAKSIDNRYGEMTYDTLFWDKYYKDLGTAMTLSMGWNLGFAREFGGGTGQLLRAPDRFVRQGIAKTINKGEMNKAAFGLTYTMVGLGWAGMMTYFLGGRAIQGIHDLFWPVVGKDQDGNEQRVSTMFYNREFGGFGERWSKEGIGPAIWDYVSNKGSGVPAVLSDVFSGKDEFGRQIYDPESPMLQRYEQELHQIFRDIEPIPMKGDAPGGKPWLPYLGFSPAPKYVTESGTETSIRMAYQQFVSHKDTPYERAEQDRDLDSIRKMYKANDPGVWEKLDAMQAKYDMSDSDVDRLEKRLDSDKTSYQNMFERLGTEGSWKEQRRILDHMSPEEREDYLEYSDAEHLRDNYEPPEEREKEGAAQ